MNAFIQENFNPDDWLAAACKRSWWNQRIITAKELASDPFQSWLKNQNEHGANIYVSMNTFVESRQRTVKGDLGRTKQDVAAIRHIYLDIDHNGQEALDRMTIDCPKPSFVLTTSPGKYQVIWKTEGFNVGEAEALQRAMALKYGADPAAIDVSRTLRMPGFLNWKYNTPFLVTSEKLSNRMYKPADFRIDRIYEHTVPRNPVSHARAGNDTQSHRDWCEVRKRIEAGENPAEVQADLAASARARGKYSPEKYAARTITAALAKEETDRIAREAWKAARRAASVPVVQKTSNQESNAMNETDRKALSYIRQYYSHAFDLSRLHDYFERLYGSKNTAVPKLAKLDAFYKSQIINNRTKPIHKEEISMSATAQQRYYLENEQDPKIGQAIFEIKNQLKSILDNEGKKSFSFDLEQGKWFTLSKSAVQEAQKILKAKLDDPAFHAAWQAKQDKSADKTDEKTFFIGNAPAGMSETIKSMSMAAKEKGEPGMRWNEENGWHTKNRELAEAVHAAILDKQPRFYLSGNTYAVRDQLSALKGENGKSIAYLDKFKGTWYAVSEENKNRIEKEVKIPPEEKKYFLGNAPKGIGEELKNISMAAREKGQAGLIWNKENGWHTTNKELAEAVHKLFLEKQPRFYLDGNTYAVKDQLSAQKDENGKSIVFLDKFKGAWFTLSEENKKKIQSEVDIPEKPPKREKLYLETTGRAEREAVFQCKEQLKDIREPGADGKDYKTFSFDEKKGEWFTYSSAALEKAKAIIAAKMKEPAFAEAIQKTEQAIEARKEKEVLMRVPLKTDGIPSEELRNRMKEKGCRFDGEQKIWTAPNEKIAMEVQAMIDAAPKNFNTAEAPENHVMSELSSNELDRPSAGGLGDD